MPSRYAPSLQRAASTHDCDVLFLIGCWEGESKRYRVWNVAEALNERGWTCRVMPFSDYAQIQEQGLTYKVLVIFRSAHDRAPGLGTLLDYSREQGARVCFDIDDLVFEPGLVDQIHGVQKLSPEDKLGYIDGVERYRELLLACDYVTVTTEPLARAVRALGKAAYVVPNGINTEQIALSDELDGLPRPGARLRVGYFSGSTTHERDFAQVAPALLALMAQRQDWELCLAGFLDLGPQWEPFADRIVRLDFLPALNMLFCVSQCDVNLAPLEVGDPFCEGKSELKYFEAALVRVPTIASPTEPFRAAIEHGRTGFLAATPDAWGQALSALLSEPALRRRTGEQGRLSALQTYGPSAIARAAEAAHGLGEAQASQPPYAHAPAAAAPATAAPETRLRIDWVIPGLIIGGGGHRNILRAAHHLQGFGHDVGVHLTNWSGTAEEARKAIHQHFYPFEGHVKVWDGQFRPSDVIMATHWTTVDAAQRGQDSTREIMYFVQDFEPAFAPMGSEYVLAENTYRLGLYCITSGIWCEHMLRRTYGSEADHFRFPVDRDVYQPYERSKLETNIVFFAKPEMPRRCFELGSMALERVKRMRPDVEMILFGSGDPRVRQVAFEATYLEIVPTVHDLARMYANMDLGLVFSTTNPSLVPYEMMASGAVVVDLMRPGNELNYDDRTDIAKLVDPRPDLMAEQIVQLLDDAEDRARRREAGLEFVKGFPSEIEMARRIESLVSARLSRA